MKLMLVKGATSVQVAIFVRDSSVTTGAGLTGLVFNTGSLTAYYWRPGGTATAITLATLANAQAAWSSGGFVAIDGTNMPGWYRLDIPNAVLASGVDTCYVMLKGATNMEPVNIEIQLSSMNVNDAVRGGMTALPNANAEASGGLFTRGTGAGQINQDANGRIDANMQAISQDSAAADNLESYCDGTTPIPSNITQIAGTAAANVSSSGRLNVNVTHFDGTAATVTSGIPSVNLAQWKGVAPLDLTSQRVNVLLGACSAGVIDAAAIGTNAIDADAIASDAGTEIANAVKAAVVETEGSYTLQQALSILLAVCAGRTADAGATFKTPNNNATRVAATTNGSNERTAMVLTPSS
jgi:hypothetical protein